MSPNVRSGHWLGSFCRPSCIKYGSGNLLAPSSYSNIVSYRFLAQDFNAPYTYTDISYESLRIAHIHGSLRFGHFHDRFKSCYKLFRAIYGLLRITTSYYDVFTAKFHDLLRVVTDNYEHLTGILRAFYGLLRVYYVLVTTCLRVVTNSDEYVRVLTIFCQKYINPANLNVSSIIRQLTPRETTWHMRETDCRYINNFYTCPFN